MKLARIALLVDRQAAEQRWKYGLNVFERYLEEILDHRGIAYQKIDHLDDLEQQSYDILLVALAKEDEQSAEQIWTFAEQGGGVILYANMNKLAKKFGYRRAKTISEGYIEIRDWEGKQKKLKFFNGSPWNPIDQTDDTEVRALLKIPVGKGFIDRWSIPIMDTIVMMHQGLHPNFEDGYPAFDGTGSIDDDILKADDQMVMDWEEDRLTTEAGAPYFAYPYADEWRDQCIGHILQRVTEKQMTLPFTGYWPADVEAVAMISHDSDGNVEEHGVTTLQVLDECDVKSSWCMIEPGYSKPLYEQIKAAGHEIAFHYNGQNHAWSGQEFTRQLAEVKSRAGVEEIVSNKNHITRFEGWGELFQWCEENGVQSDQTRGPSKSGNVGFLFGTCHPYFPIAWSNERNRLYDVLEIGFLTQDMDLGKWADSSVVEPFLDTVKRMEGVAHFLFHQVHLHERPAVRKAFDKVVKEARKRGYVFWTGEQINGWQRARRKIKVESITSTPKGKVHVQMNQQNKQHGVNVYIPLPSSAEGEVGIQDGTITKLYGIRCLKRTISI